MVLRGAGQEPSTLEREDKHVSDVLRLFCDTVDFEAARGSTTCRDSCKGAVAGISRLANDQGSARLVSLIEAVQQHK